MKAPKTLKVRILVSMAGVNYTRHVGDEVELPEAEARRLIESGAAEPAKATREHAVAKAPERTEKK